MQPSRRAQAILRKPGCPNKSIEPAQEQAGSRYSGLVRGHSPACPWSPWQIVRWRLAITSANSDSRPYRELKGGKQAHSCEFFGSRGDDRKRQPGPFGDVEQRILPVGKVEGPKSGEIRIRRAASSG